MKTVSFELKRPDDVKNSSIFFRFRCEDGMLKYYTGISGNNHSISSNPGILTVLNRIQNEISVLQVECRILEKPLLKECVTGRLDKLLRKKPNVGNLWGIIDDVIDKLATGKILTPENRIYSQETVKSITRCKNNLKKFNENLRFQDVTMDTYKAFIAFGVSKDWSLNSIGSEIKFWKTLMRLTFAHHQNKIYDDAEFKILREETDDVHLEEEEIKALENVDLGNAEHLQPARDWFVINCYLGTRVSDLLRINKSSIIDGFIILATEKTNEKIKLPLHPAVKRIIDKHKGLPPNITSQNLNSNIKQIGKIASNLAPSLKSNFLYVVTKGGSRTEERVPKYDMLSSHTARRTSITNMRAAGVPDTIVMKLHGIKSAKTLERYTKITAEKAGDLAAKLDYFKG